jgi:hypothetical protein
MIDHDEFLPAIVIMSHTSGHVNISRQYNRIHYNNNAAQHGARYNITERTTLARQKVSTHLSTANVHKARPIDSALFAQPMSHNSTCRCPTLVHLRNDSPALAVVVLYHTLVDSTLGLSRM